MRLRDTPFQPSRINTTTANITNPTTQHLHIQTPPLASLHPPHSLRLRPPIHIRHTQHHPGHPTNLRHPIRPVPRLTHLPNNIPPNRRVKEKPVPPANQPPPPTTPSPNHTQEGKDSPLLPNPSTTPPLQPKPNPRRLPPPLQNVLAPHQRLGDCRAVDARLAHAPCAAAGADGDPLEVVGLVGEGVGDGEGAEGPGGVCCFEEEGC